MTDRCRRLLAAGLALTVVACSSSVSNPSINPSGSQPLASGGQPSQRPGKTQRPGATGSGRPSSVPATPGAPTAAATPGTPIPGIDQLTGSDGRFTMLVLGSDARGQLSGERTDTIMIVTIDPATGKVSMISLPRDTEKVPIAPGVVYGPKVTGLFQDYKLSHGANRTQQFHDMVKAMEYAFGIEIDRYALAHFTSVTHLIDAIGGIDVTLAKKFVDTSKPTSHIVPGGLRLKAGVNHLDGIHTLAFCRSRETTSDYDRARRQQVTISVTIQKVLGMGIDAIPALAQTVLGDSGIETNLQASDAVTLFALARQARLSSFKSFVLEPSQYASGGGPPTYATFMRVTAVRALFSRIFSGP